MRLSENAIEIIGKKPFISDKMVEMLINKGNNKTSYKEYKTNKDNK